jgi:ubiquinone biosynthesis protein COQ4
MTAIRDPKRADRVAAVGEVTGSYALSCMLRGMKSNVTGRRILIDRPLVDDVAVHRAAVATTIAAEEGVGGGITFGRAYTDFLRKHSFDPNDRSSIKYLHDPELAYVMTRYRQCHDYFHVLTDLPPTVLGELGLKLLELMQTGLPLAALSVASATISGQLSPREEEVLWSIYLPWAVRVGRGTMKEHGLMCVYYEEEYDTDLEELRKRMGIEVAPSIEL